MAACAALGDGNVLMLENLRFHKQEEKNDADFAAALVRDSGAKIYVNDAFGTAHRAHASTAGVTAHVEHSVAGLLLQKELKYMNEAVLASPKRPLIAIVGGSKVLHAPPPAHVCVPSDRGAAHLLTAGRVGVLLPRASLP